MKITARASSDIALVKYWGKKDEILRLPENGSVSMVLDGLDTVTTVEFNEKYDRDYVYIEDFSTEANAKESKRVSSHLDLIRSKAGITTFAKVFSKNTFPKGTGLSSSGSGLAALTFATTKAAGLEISQRELSILARQGSGTACRCTCGGFVEWKDAQTSDDSYSETIFDPQHFDIRDIVVVVDEGMKKISSTEGHESARSSIFFEARQANIKQKIADVKNAIANKDFAVLGELVEAECLEFHSILLTSKPPMVLWYPGTLEVMQEVEKMRQDGILAFYTINTGFNLHVLTLPEFETVVRERISKLSLVKKTILTKVGNAPSYLEEHLF